MDLMGALIKGVNMKKVANFFLGFLIGLNIFCSNLMASEVTFNSALQSFTGSIGLVSFFQSVVIMATVLGVMTALKLSLDAFRSPYKGGGGSRR